MTDAKLDAVALFEARSTYDWQGQSALFDAIPHARPWWAVAGFLADWLGSALRAAGMDDPEELMAWFRQRALDEEADLLDHPEVQAVVITIRGPGTGTVRFPEGATGNADAVGITLDGTTARLA